MSSAASQPLPGTMPSMDSEEERMLKELITWPEPPGTITFTSSTSARNCDFRILHPRASYSVGENLEVVLTARDQRALPKTYGGDFFRAKLHSFQLKAGVLGSVHDHMNGTYIVTFLLPWPGDVEISIQLRHSSEAVQILKKLRDSRPDKVFFYGHFQMNGTTEVMECNLEIPDRPLCEYVDPRTGEKWVCVRPETLPCSSYIYHSSGGNKRITTIEEDRFFDHSLMERESRSKEEGFEVLPEPEMVLLNTSSCSLGLAVPQPTGFYYNDVWTSLTCSHKMFASSATASACLKGKIVYMFGDSTLRQWWEYLLELIPSIKQIDLHVVHKSGPLLAVDADNGFMMQWRGHGNPLRTDKMRRVNLHYMANDIAGIGDGPDVVIAFTAWAHFTCYPVEVYIQRLRNIRGAIKELLERSPQTTVIIKTANTGAQSVYGSDWLSLQLDLVMKKMFSDLPVAIVDTWEMTSCHYLDYQIHPEKVIVQNEVDMFLSFICPS
ncbi:NXPE family member 3-like [Ambystoma mexicanum]|uniref:NXPE family member 3-like n=1 Tax=Ambystoma mexicanum TaxID=8296 RepID=UPI0037E7485A